MSEDSTIEMFVHGLVLDASAQAPVIVLKDASGEHSLPIWIGIAEATSIASAIKNLNLTRPLTHDLLYDIILKAGLKVEKIIISELRESTYYADIILVKDQETIVLDARPSDAIAIAIRAGASILVAQNVLDIAKQSQAKGQASEDEESPDNEATNFQVIDKDKWAQILEDLDPEDFKHKM